jgi:hypothetical protein
MQSGQTLSPNGIIASQKVHAAVPVPLFVLDATTNNIEQRRRSY